ATLIDKSFARNWTGAGQAGLRRGAYHFYHPTRDPIKQADNFIRRVTLKAGDFAPVLDFEVTNSQPDANILRDLRIWLDAIEDHYDQKPIIYTNAYLYKRFIKGHLADYPLWIADYSNAHLRQYDPTNLYIWQHNKSGLVPGISGMVDINTFVQEPDNLRDICL
ncbi:MAG: glycoside hydrolase, partial [Bacteroidetes bacterium]|nr:glycoside hydrolase [Fibrella sp.]